MYVLLNHFLVHILRESLYLKLRMCKSELVLFPKVTEPRSKITADFSKQTIVVTFLLC